jgi:heterodisulfide reductase subunit B
MRLAYYPGCTLKTTAKNFESSALTSAKALGIEMIELPRWNCCGTVHALVKDDVMHYIAPIRSLVRVEEMNAQGLIDDKRLVTLCEMCFNTLKRANAGVREDAERMRKVRDIMADKDPQYGGGAEVVHYLEVIRELGWDKVKERVERPLKGLRVAPYYGCLLLRPKGVGIDDVNAPSVLERLVESLGAEVVDIPFKSKCCGSYHTVQMKQVVSELSHRILEQAIEARADAITLACPLCEYNLGGRQGEVKKMFRGFGSIPVVYFTQLMALAFGLPAKAIGLDENKPDPRPILREKGLAQE